MQACDRHGHFHEPRGNPADTGKAESSVAIPDGMHLKVRHKTVRINGIEVFYREAGHADAPVLLLPHGYPCSSYQFRNLMPALADHWRLLAPDLPAFGYTETPELSAFDYSFNGYADLLDAFVTQLGIDRHAIYLQDYGSQIGLRLAIKAPQRITALIIQNGDIYEDELGPKYAGLKEYWDNPSPSTKAVLEEAVSEEGFKDEFLNQVDEDMQSLIPPDLWKLHWSLTQDNALRREVYVHLMEGLKENLQWFPRYQQYLRDHQPPALIAWGPNDGFMPEGAARAYLRDLQNAELHLLGGGHWLLETHLPEMIMLIRNFLKKHTW